MACTAPAWARGALYRRRMEPRQTCLTLGCLLKDFGRRLVARKQIAVIQNCEKSRTFIAEHGSNSEGYRPPLERVPGPSGTRTGQWARHDTGRAIGRQGRLAVDD